MKIEKRTNEINEGFVHPYLSLYIAIYEQAIIDIAIYNEVGCDGTGGRKLSKQEVSTAKRWLNNPSISFFDSDFVKCIKERVMKNEKEKKTKKNNTNL